MTKKIPDGVKNDILEAMEYHVSKMRRVKDDYEEYIIKMEEYKKEYEDALTNLLKSAQYYDSMLPGHDFVGQIREAAKMTPIDIAKFRVENE